jgi:hypothetical protein
MEWMKRTRSGPQEYGIIYRNGEPSGCFSKTGLQIENAQIRIARLKLEKAEHEKRAANPNPFDYSIHLDY